MISLLASASESVRVCECVVCALCSVNKTKFRMQINAQTRAHAGKLFCLFSNSSSTTHVLMHTAHTTFFVFSSVWLRPDMFYLSRHLCRPTLIDDMFCRSTRKHVWRIFIFYRRRVEQDPIHSESQTEKNSVNERGNIIQVSASCRGVVTHAHNAQFKFHEK